MLTPRVRVRSWLRYVLPPIFLIVCGPFILAYRLFVGWWLDPLSNKYFEKGLREQVRTDLAFLFRDFDARFVANNKSYKNAIAVVVEAADLRIVVSQHHGEYGISVARRDNPENTVSLDSILEVIYDKEGSPLKLSYTNLAELGELFRERFRDVLTAVGNECYADTVAAIDRRRQEGMQNMAQVFNRPGGFFEADVVSVSDLQKKAPQ